MQFVVTPPKPIARFQLPAGDTVRSTAELQRLFDAAKLPISRAERNRTARRAISAVGKEDTDKDKVIYPKLLIGTVQQATVTRVTCASLPCTPMKRLRRKIPFTMRTLRQRRSTIW